MKTMFKRSIQDRKILIEQIMIISQIQVPVLAISLVIATALSYGLWNVTSRFSLIVWMSLMLGAVVIRAAVFYRYIRHIRLEEQVKWHLIYFVTGNFVSGLLWGVGAVVLFPAGLLEYQLFILIALMGMGIGSLSTLTAFLPAYLAYFPISLMPMSIKLFLETGSIYVSLAVMTVVFIVALTYIGIKISGSFKQSLGLRFENRELVNQLREQKSAAEIANIAKSKFLAVASHDLRQPLHALTLFTSVLDEMIQQPKERSVVEQIKSSVHALQNLFNSLLDISQLDAGVMKVEKTGFHLQPLFEKLANDFEPQAKEKELQFLWSPCTYAVYSDQNLLEQILRNYISNAIRYTDKGEIRITCEVINGKIKINIIDSGLGIRLGDQKIIFEEFHQLSNPERDRSKGLGLGLAIVQRTAKLLGHTIAVESEAGKGSTFSISVEQVNISKSEKKIVPIFDDDVSQFEDTLILVIDDEASVRKGIESLFQVWNCDVITAADQEEAIILLRQQDKIPDGIISDYRLRKNKTGIEVIDAIHARYGSEIPALIVTGDIEIDRLRDVNNSGFQVLHKPVAPLKLYTFLRNVQLRKKELSD